MNTDLPLRQQLIDTAQAMHRGGLGQGTTGNVSVRGNGGYWITPSARRYEECSAADMVFVDMAGSSDGPHRPSSEWRLHHDIYLTRPEVNAVLHCHAPACTALACLRQSIPAFHYMVAMAGGDDIRCAPYATFGTQQLSDLALQALANRKACLLANHGLVCVERDLPRVLELSLVIEELAGIYCQTLQIGAPVLLDHQQMAEVLAKFTDYTS